MDRPRWDRLEEWARAEAYRYLADGLAPHPTLVFFEGDEPTLYVRAGAAYATGVRSSSDALRWQQLFGMGMVIHPERAALLSTGRLRTEDDDAPVGEAEGEAAVFVSWARRGGTAPERGGAVLPYGLDDTGAVRWGERFELPDGGPPGRYLVATVTGRWSDEEPSAAHVEMPAAELAYAVSRYGFALGVEPGWRECYGLDQPITPRGVRPEDRTRASRLSRGRRRTTEARS